MHTPVRYEDASKVLVECIPELQDVYDREVQWWGGTTPLARPLYDEILLPYVISLLQSGDPDADEKLTRVFALVERFSTADDGRLRDLVISTILPSLLPDHKVLSRARRYTGRATSKLLKRSPDIRSISLR